MGQHHRQDRTRRRRVLAESVGHDGFDGIPPDLINEAARHGRGPQLVHSLVQVDLPGGEQRSARLATRAEYLDG
jgi:hypothetical protein